MAETWITITEQLLKGKFAASEWDAFESGALPEGVTTIIPDAIEATVGRVQGAVRASGLNTVGPALTVPPELLSATIALFREELAARIPNSGIVFDDLRKDQLRDAKALLERVESGAIKQITPPETPGGVVADGGSYGGDCLINFGSGCHGYGYDCGFGGTYVRGTCP